MSDDQRGYPEPPQAPEIQRKIQVSRTQLIGVPLLMLLPILALFGVFGDSLNTAAESSPVVELTVEYPTRTRYLAPQTLEVAVRNTSAEALDSVTVSFDRSYIDAFEDVTFTPEVSEIGDQVYEVQVDELPAGETRRITVDFKPRSYGTQRGTVTVSSTDPGGPQVAVTTFVFP